MRILRELSRVARRTWRNFLDISSLPFNSPLAFLTYTYTRNYYFIGTLPGIVIKLISEGKADFNGCEGPFTLPTDLSSIQDINRIDLRSLRGALQGRIIPSGMFFCLWRTSALFLGEISCIRILREFSRVARRTCRNFLEISSLHSSSLLASLSLSRTHTHTHTPSFSISTLLSFAN